LRVVSGTAGSGGSVAFTTAFGTPSVSGSVSLSGSVGDTTLTIAQIPSHTHTITLPTEVLPGFGYYFTEGSDVQSQTNTTNATGGGGSHTHGFSGSGTLSGALTAINVQYVDTIICTKS
jgi:hypothetical protein